MSTLICVGNNDVNEKHLKVGLRLIADEFLLQHGDSTTRILPIEKEGGRYVIRFEKELGFEPDLLSSVAKKVVKENLTFKKLIVETVKCSTDEVVHSFEINNRINDNMIPCKARALPVGCYEIYFTITQLSYPKELAKTGLSIAVPVVLGILLILIGLYIRKSRKQQNINPELTQIGEYQFDKKGMRLIYKGKSEELSGKEAHLLELLFENESKTLERDFLLNKVWGDEGDYVGRTLDVFISKIRKKLEQDLNVKVINVRGVGYRMVINV